MSCTATMQVGGCSWKLFDTGMDELDQLGSSLIPVLIGLLLA